MTQKLIDNTKNEYDITTSVIINTYPVEKQPIKISRRERRKLERKNRKK